MDYPERDFLLYHAYIASEARFFTMKDIQEMTGWSEKTVKKLFNDPKFPSADYGRNPPAPTSQRAILYRSIYPRKKRNRKALSTTVSELHAMAPAQNAGSNAAPPKR